MGMWEYAKIYVYMPSLVTIWSQSAELRNTHFHIFPLPAIKYDLGNLHLPDDVGGRRPASSSP